jgi:hypothetical protein
MFNGYLGLAGNEIINAARTAAYIRHQLPRLDFTDVHADADLQEALGDEKYESPLIDNAPWADEHNLASLGFYGAYPLDIQGVRDSSRTASVTETMEDGGMVSDPREATKEIRVKALLVGHDEAALEVGRSWLTAALRTGGCGTHDGACGTSDLEYFVSPPRICSDAVDRDRPVTSFQEYRAVTPETSPLSFRFPRPHGPATATWTFPYQDGTIVEWGALELNGPRERERSGPVLLQRTNHLPNPTFKRGALRWSGDAADLVPRTEGGVDAAEYVEVQQRNAPVRRFSYFPDGNMNFDADGAGWRTNSAVGPVAYLSDPTSPTGGQVAAARASEEQPRVYIENTLRGPVAGPRDGLVTFRLGPRLSNVEVTLTNPDGRRTGVVTLPTSGNGWFEVELTGTLQVGAVVRIEATPDAVDGYVAADGFLAEVGTVKGEFFTGLTQGSSLGYGSLPFGEGPYGGGAEGEVANEWTYAWINGDPYQGAYAVFGQSPIVMIRSDATDTPAGPLVGAVWLRSTVPNSKATLVLETDAGSTTVRDILLTDQWASYVITAARGRSSRISVLANTSFDIDHASLESAVSYYGYFDGSGTRDGYTITWLGKVHDSPSRMAFTDRGAFATSADDSDWRPYLRVTEGALAGGSFTSSQFEPLDPSACVERFVRTMHGVSCIEGPREVRRVKLRGCDVALIEVEFLLLATNPYSFTSLVDLPVPDLAQIPAHVLVDADCGTELAESVLQDPLCAPLLLPPRPPVIMESCGFQTPASWQRRWLEIPAAEVAGWAKTMPVLWIDTTNAEPIRNLRVRIFPNPFGYDGQRIDPCSWCSEFVISYLPANTRMAIDSRSQYASVVVNGKAPTSANHVLYGTEGEPMTWPVLECGIPHMIAIDVGRRANGTAPALGKLDVSLSVREA